jgi:hypothetical protein
LTVAVLLAAGFLLGGLPARWCTSHAQVQDRLSENPGSGDNAVPVTADNYIRAETDRAFAGEIKLNDSFGRLHHRRQLIALDDQVVPRVNCDTIYSSAVFDLDAGPVTITKPENGKRFMSLIVIDEDHFVHGVYYGAGSHTLSKDKIGTRYVFAALRTLVDPQDHDDLTPSTPCRTRRRLNSRAVRAPSKSHTGTRRT